MTTADVRVGDDVKNGRSGAWGCVVSLRVDEVTGRITRIRVRRHLGDGRYQHEPTWWDASSITMLEKRRA